MITSVYTIIPAMGSPYQDVMLCDCRTLHYVVCHAGKVADGGGDSDREGSITPTNETPPSEELLEESTTPKDKV